jgi:hypothetical protein
LRTLAVTAAAATAHTPSRAGAAEVGAAKEEDALRRCYEQLRVQYEPPSQIEGDTLNPARALEHRAVRWRRVRRRCDDALAPLLASPVALARAIRWVEARTLVSGAALADRGRCSKPGTRARESRGPMAARAPEMRRRPRASARLSSGPRSRSGHWWVGARTLVSGGGGERVVIRLILTYIRPIQLPPLGRNDCGPGPGVT